MWYALTFHSTLNFLAIWKRAKMWENNVFVKLFVNSFPAIYLVLIRLITFSQNHKYRCMKTIFNNAEQYKNIFLNFSENINRK